MKIGQAGSRHSINNEDKVNKLKEIQKKEKIKTMLITKFRAKYSQRPDLGTYIDREVERYLDSEKLSE